MKVLVNDRLTYLQGSMLEMLSHLKKGVGLGDNWCGPMGAISVCRYSNGIDGWADLMLTKDSWPPSPSQQCTDAVFLSMTWGNDRGASSSKELLKKQRSELQEPLKRLIPGRHH